MLAYVLLGVAQTIGLLITPLGAPGVWIQLAALALYGWWSGFAIIGPMPLLILLLLSLTAELAATLLAGRTGSLAQRRRIGYGGLAGGGAGAAAGLVLPLLGNVFGALVGSLAGSLIGAAAARLEGIGCAALCGLVVGMTARTAAGVIVAVFTLITLAS